MDAHGLKLKIKKIEPLTLMESVFDFYSSTLNSSKIKIEKNFSPIKIGDFYSDRDKLEEILDNIISNAIKFVNSENGIIRLGLKEDNESIFFSVKDNGVGFDSAYVHKIFQVFERLHGDDWL